MSAELQRLLSGQSGDPLVDHLVQFTRQTKPDILEVMTLREELAELAAYASLELLTDEHHGGWRSALPDIEPAERVELTKSVRYLELIRHLERHPDDMHRWRLTAAASVAAVEPAAHCACGRPTDHPPCDTCAGIRPLSVAEFAPESSTHAE